MRVAVFGVGGVGVIRWNIGTLWNGSLDLIDNIKCSLQSQFAKIYALAQYSWKIIK